MLHRLDTLSLYNLILSILINRLILWYLYILFQNPDRFSKAKTFFIFFSFFNVYSSRQATASSGYFKHYNHLWWFCYASSDSYDIQQGVPDNGSMKFLSGILWTRQIFPDYFLSSFFSLHFWQKLFFSLMYFSIISIIC